jgi:hypothetical protein
MFCQNCGTKLVDGGCASCTSKSTNGLSMESLEKSLATLEELSKGVRPAEGKISDSDKRTAKKVAEEVKEQVKGYGDHGEGDSEEEPKTTKNVESAAKKGGFVPPDAEEEEEDPRRREEEEEEEEQQQAAPQMPFKSAGKKAKKSFADELIENEPVRKAVDVSDFLEGVVYQLGEMTDGLRGDVHKSLKFAGYQQNFNVGLAKAMVELGSIVKSLTEQVERMGKTPAGIRKSEQTAAALEKSFDSGNAATNGTLTKSQMASKLTALWEAGDTSVSPADILRADSEGYVKPELREKIGLEKQ